MKKNNKPLQVIISTLSLIVLALGASLQVKATLGLGPWDALTATIAELTGLKFGTASIVSNSVMIGLQLLILRSKFKLSYWWQVPIMFLFGSVMNFFLYNILLFEVNSYIFGLILFIIGNFLAALANAFLVSIDIVIMPPEGFSSAVAKVSKYDFSQVRIGLDVFVIIFCLLSTFLLNTTLVIREGTILASFLYNFFLRIILQSKFLKSILKQ